MPFKRKNLRENLGISGGTSRKRSLTVSKMDESNTQSIDIRSHGEVLRLYYFWCEIAGCSDKRSGHCLLSPRSPKVCQFNLNILPLLIDGRNKNILRLDIAVDDIPMVLQLDQSLEHLLKDLDEILL